MAEKKKYKKKNNFTLKFFYNEEGEKLEQIIERAFENYYLKKTKSYD